MVAACVQNENDNETLVFENESSANDIKELFQRKCYHKVVFRRCPILTSKSLCDNVPYINQDIDSLEIHNTSWMNDECIELLTAYCSKLHKVELHGSLKEITPAGIESISRNCDSILSLSLKATSGTDLQTWVLDNRLFTAIINNMTSNLRHFGLSGFDVRIEAFGRFLQHFSETLHSLDFSALSVINDESLRLIGMYCHRLFVLKLNDCSVISDVGIKYLFSYHLNMEILELSGCTGLTDASINFVVNNCTKLQIINLKACTGLTELSLRMLSNCQRLCHVNFACTLVRYLPCELSRLCNLNQIDLEGCDDLLFPSSKTISNGIANIKKTLREYDISRRVCCFAVGNDQCRKSNLIFSLIDRGETALVEHDNVTVKKWFPPCSTDNEPISFCMEFWDFIEKKALEEIPSMFANKRSIYIVSFDLAVYSSIRSVSQWVCNIQAKSPGAFIVIVGCQSEACETKKTELLCDKIFEKLNELENDEVKNINKELIALRKLGLFPMIACKRKKLEWLLCNRPRIHEKILIVDSVNEEGVDELRKVILRSALPKLQPVSFDVERVYCALGLLQDSGSIVVTWSEVKEIMVNCDVKDDKQMLQIIEQLQDLGLVLPLHPLMSLSEDWELTPDTLVCIHPSLLVDIIFELYCIESLSQELLDKLSTRGDIEQLWPGKQPYDWTLRKTFDQILLNGKIQEAIIPLLLMKWKLSLVQVERIIDILQQMFVIFAGAPNSAYEVELVVPSMKTLSVSKMYYLPFQGKLPAIPQLNAWPLTCPSSHVELGWHYHFLSTFPSFLLLTLVSACTTIKRHSRVLSYWNAGAYIQVGDILLNISRWEDMSIMQLAVRVPQGQGGARQAVNRGWCCLCKYIFIVEKYLHAMKGLHYVVFTLSTLKCSPLMEVVDNYETGVLSSPDVLWLIPIKGNSRNEMSLPTDYLRWIHSIYVQCIVHVSCSTEDNVVITAMCDALESACYEPRTHSPSYSSLVVVALTSNYSLSDLPSAIHTPVIVALLEDCLNQRLAESDILSRYNQRVDLSGASETGGCHRLSEDHVAQLISLCNLNLFAQKETFKRDSLVTACRPKKGEFSDIVKKYSDMPCNTQIRNVAATAVAASIASATADHISKQSNPTMGAKAAARAAEVAEAVAQGDAQKTVQAVLACAKAVDEAVTYSNSLRPNVVPSKPTKSSMCVLL